MSLVRGKTFQTLFATRYAMKDCHFDWILCKEMAVLPCDYVNLNRLCLS